MPTLDPERNLVVVRIVYDGPPHSGKTTSLHALAGHLSKRSRSDVSSPGEEAGRTVFFDWMDYEGGLIGGYGVRTQIVSVPGQRSLSKRRKFLLETADSVVFVADTQQQRIATNSEYVEALVEILDRRPSPPVGLVVQANKRDLAAALPIERIRELWGKHSALSVIESVATKGDGIREAFIFAVRLALDRVRVLISEGSLVSGPPRIDSPDTLLRALREAIGDSPLDPGSPGSNGGRSRPSTSLAAKLVQEVLTQQQDGAVTQEDQSAARTEPTLTGRVSEPWAPNPPNSKVLSGLVYPPIVGRVLLKSLEQVGISIRPEPGSHGGWTAHSTQWIVHSSKENHYDKLEAARHDLISWARLSRKLEGLLSTDRCVTVAATGEGGWRLWQVVRSAPSLRSQLEACLTQPAAPLEKARRTCELLSFLLEARQLFDNPIMTLQARLDTVGVEDGRPVFSRLLATEAVSAPSTVHHDPAPEHIHRQAFALQLLSLLPANGERSIDLPLLLETVRYGRPTAQESVRALATWFTAVDGGVT